MATLEFESVTFRLLTESQKESTGHEAYANITMLVGCSTEAGASETEGEIELRRFTISKDSEGDCKAISPRFMGEDRTTKFPYYDGSFVNKLTDIAVICFDRLMSTEHALPGEVWVVDNESCQQVD